MSVLGAGEAFMLASGEDAEFRIERSLRFDSTASSHLNRTPSSAGNRRTWTWSGWVKRSELGARQFIFEAGTADTATDRFMIRFENTSQLTITTGQAANRKTNQVFRDISSWGHLVVAVDTTLSTANDRIKVYWNGSQIDINDFSSPSNPSQYANTAVNSAAAHSIGKTHIDNGNYLGAYLAEVHLIDGQALAPTDFGEFDATTGVWQPKEYTHSSATTSGSFTLADNDFTWNDTRSSAPNDPDSGVLTDGTLNYADTFWGNPGANGAYLDIDMTGASTGEAYEVRYWNAAEAGGQTITATCKQIDSSGNDITGTAQAQTWNQGQKWNTYIQTIASNCDKIRLIFSNNNNNSFGWGIGEVQVNFIPSNVNDFHLDFSNSSALGSDAAGNNNFTANNLLSSDGTIYSSGAAFSPSQLSASRGGDKAFDGLTSTNASASTANGSNVTITFSPSLTNVSSLEVYSNSGNSFAYINGSSGTTVNISAGSYTSLNTLASGASGTISSLSVQTNGDNAQIAAIKVNGAILVDGDKGDVMIDSPMNYEASSGNNGGNYATYNPLALHNTADTVSEGNLKLTSSGSGMSHMGRGTIAMKSGKWYFEVTWVDTQHNFVGIVGQNDTGYNNSYIYLSNAKKSNSNGNSEGSSYGATWGNGDIIGVAFDADNGTLVFYKNGVSQGTAFTGIATDGSAGTYSPYPQGYVAITGNWNHNAATSHINFGQRPFSISSVPTGYKSLCTQNLPDPLIEKGASYFDAKLYQGNGGNQQITGLGFSPDLVWIKNRSTVTNQVHAIFDKQRGEQMLSSSSSQSEANWHGSNGVPYRGYVNSFDTNGFSLVKNSASNLADYVNYNNATYVAWSWDAGDLVTNSAHNQSQTWSSTVSSSNTSYQFPFERGFDGVITGDGGTAGFAGWTSNGAITLTFSNLSASSNVVVYAGSGLDSSISATCNIGGTNYTQSASSGYVNTLTFNNTGAVTTLSLTSGGGGVRFYGIKVDSKILVNPGVVPVGTYSSNSPSIGSTVRANQSAGFSIVSYRGAGSSGTIAHGLDAAPEMVFYKSRGDANDWMVYHVGMGATKSMLLNDGGRDASRADTFNNTAPTSLLLHVGGSATTSNSNSAGMIAYCFASVPGYSSFGTFVGNGSANGPFVYTGFRPRWIMVKGQTYAGNWNIFDATRPTYNETDGVLRANLSNPEFDGSAQGTYALGVDLLSNGFKIRQQGVDANSSGQTLIYAAFAEHPLKTARAK